MTNAQKALQQMIEDRPAVRLLVEVFGLEIDQADQGAFAADPDGIPSAATEQRAPAGKKKEGQQLALAL
jgi:hypothetical protein